MLSPRALLFSSTRYLVSASEPLATSGLIMFQNLISRFFFSGTLVGLDGSGTGSYSPPPQPFSTSTCLSWFDHLCLREEGRMTPDDILAFCESIHKSPDDIVFLILSYKMGVKTCGFIKQVEWVTGMGQFEIDSSPKLVEKWDVLKNLLNTDSDLERNVYRFSYDYIRDRDKDGGRLDISLSMELVRMFLEDKWPYCHAFLTFLTLTNVKSLTRDQFMNVIDFSRDLTSLEDYDDTGAWPLLLDEFVAHVQGNKGLYQIQNALDIKTA